MTVSESSERIQAEDGPANRHLDARVAEIRANADDEDRTGIEEQAADIRGAIDRDETTREAVEAGWDNLAAEQDRRVAALDELWVYNEQVVERCDAILDNAEALPHHLQAAEQGKAMAVARIEGYKAELDDIAVSQVCIGELREVLGWGKGDEEADTVTATAPGSGVETPQNERGHTNVSAVEETQSERERTVAQAQPSSGGLRDLLAQASHDAAMAEEEQEKPDRQQDNAFLRAWQSWQGR